MYKIFFVILAFLSIALIFSGIVVLQMFLSKKENKWYGLSFAIVLFLIMPLLGWVFFVIHFYQRKNFKTDKELEKMNIQDL